MKRLMYFILIFFLLLTVSSCDSTGHLISPIDPSNIKHTITITGDRDVVYTKIEDETYSSGDIVELKTHILMDADIEVYLGDFKIPKTHYDSDYWGYMFVMHNKHITLNVKVVDGFKIQLPMHPIGYYDYVSIKNPVFVKTPEFLEELELEERIILTFKDYTEYEAFVIEHLGGIYYDDLKVHHDHIYDTNRYILVARRTNYNGHYRYSNYDNTKKTIEEDIICATFEETIIKKIESARRFNAQ